MHCDLAPTAALWNQREDYAGLLGDCGTVCLEDRPLADLINPLVITDTETIKPVAYDFDPRFDIATIHDLTSEVLYLAKRERLLPQSLIGNALAALKNGRDFVDWFDHLTRLSESESEAAAGAISSV